MSIGVATGAFPEGAGAKTPISPERCTGRSRSDAGSCLSPKGELETASPGRRPGPAAETHDRGKAPAAARTGLEAMR
jgi:hypothetical protein